MDESLVDMFCSSLGTRREIMPEGAAVKVIAGQPVRKLTKRRLVCSCNESVAVNGVITVGILESVEWQEIQHVDSLAKVSTAKVLG